MAKVAEEPPAVPRVRSVFRDLEGKLRHARCGRTMSLVGIRGGVELDFHCVGCWEHVTLTESTLGQVPVGQDTD